MRPRTFDYDEIFPCTCVGGRTSCGVIGVNKFAKGEIELGFSDKKARYRGHTRNPHICLNKEQIKKLITYLQKALKED